MVIILTVSSEFSFFRDLYSNDVIFKFKDLFVIHQNPFFENIVIYAIYKQKDYYLLDVDSNFPFLSRPERISFNNYETYLKSTSSDENFMLLYYSSDQGLKLEELSKNQVSNLNFNSPKRNSFIIPKSMFNRINVDVEKSILSKSDIILWLDNEGTTHIKLISESDLKKNSLVFVKGQNKFILRSRDSHKAYALFDYLNDISESIINPQLKDFRILTFDLLQNLLIPLNKDILLKTVLFDEPLQPLLDKIISFIIDTHFKTYSYKLKLIEEDFSKLKYVFYVKADNSELISLYNKTQDIFITELNKIPLLSPNKEILSNLVNLDVIPYESKLYG